MAVHVLCSASGAPGVTTTALGLALTWPRPVLLVDADRTPAQAVQAGYLRGSIDDGRGLVSMLQAHRERHDLGDELLDAATELPPPPRPASRGGAAEPTVTRRFLPGFSHPQTVDVFAPVWRPLFQALSDAPFDSVVDAGRIGHRGLPPEVVDAAARLLVVTRTSLPALAALRLHLPGLVDRAAPGRVGLIVVGPGRPYGAGEVAEAFDLPVDAEIPLDVTGASELSEGLDVSPRWHGQALPRAYAATASSLVAAWEKDRLAQRTVADEVVSA